MREPPGNMPSPSVTSEGRHHDTMWDPFAPRPRRWFHQQQGDTDPQLVEPLGWTQHHCIVLALEEGFLPQGEPVAVRLSEMRPVTE